MLFCGETVDRYDLRLDNNPNDNETWCAVIRVDTNAICNIQFFIKQGGYQLLNDNKLHFFVGIDG